MLLNDLTVLLLESTNPKIDDGMTNSERLTLHLNANILVGDKSQVKRPCLSRPKVEMFYTEKDIGIPFALISNVSDGFIMGDAVSIKSSKLMETFNDYDEFGTISEVLTEENLFQGYNNLPDSLILGVYFHSIIVNNGYQFPLTIERNTTRKLKPFGFDVKLLYLPFHDVEVWDFGYQNHILTMDKPYSKLFKVAVKPTYSRDNKKGTQKAKAKSDSEVNDVTDNVGAEEIER